MKLTALKIHFIILVSCCLLLVASPTEAAVLYLEPFQGEYYQGDTFIVEMRIDTEGECINTVEANLSFSQDILEAVDFSQGSSVLTLWLETPQINQESGLISFIGGIPGGYCGVLPGEPGRANLLGRIIFKIQETSDRRQETRDKQQGWVRFLETSQVLLNDGMGTPAKLTLKEAIFTIFPEKAKVPKEEWQEELKKDNILPEPFEIEIHQDPAIFEGKYFIIFSTSDKQTGIDHYEICEHTKPHECEREKTRKWKKAESPYLLEDQSLKSKILVKAVDKAGNERIAEWIPPKKPFPWWIIVLVFIGYWLYKISKRIRIKLYGETK